MGPVYTGRSVPMSVALGSNTAGVDAEASPTPAGRGVIASQWLIDLYWRRRWVFLSLLVGFYAAAYTGRWQPEPDSALYLSLGRNLAQGQGYTYLGEPHALAYPGMPYLIAGLFGIFGIGAEWAPHAAVFVLTLVGLALLYRLFYLHVGPRPAVFLTCMVGMNFTLFQYAFELRNDVPFAVGVLAFLVGVESWRRRAAQPAPPATPPNPQSEIRPPQSPSVPWYDTLAPVLGLALAAVMRPHVWVLIGAVALAGALTVFRLPRKRAIVVALAVVILVSGTLLAIAARGGAVTYEAAIRDYLAKLSTVEGWRTVGANGWKIIDSSLPEAAFGHQMGPGITPVIGLVLVGLCVSLLRRRWLWGLFAIGTLLMVLVILPAPRYLLPIVPLVAVAWFGAICWLNHRLPRPWGNVVFAVLLAMWVVPNFLKITKLIAEQRSPTFAATYGEAGSVPALQAISHDIAAIVPPDAYVLAHKKVARVLAYWSDRYVAAPYELPAAAHEARLYVLQPMDEEVRIELAQHRLALGREIAREPATGRKQAEDWVVRELVAAPPPAASPVEGSPVVDRAAHTAGKAATPLR
jgi:hypothetical protein